MLHLFEILPPLISVYPGTVVLAQVGDNINPAHVAMTIKKKYITILTISESLLKVLLEYFEVTNNVSDKILGKLRVIWPIGEASKPQHLIKLKSFAPQARIFKTYGLSETHAPLGGYIEHSVNELSKLTVLPLGPLLAGYKCLIINEDDGQMISPSNPGKIGQIYISGIV